MKTPNEMCRVNWQMGQAFLPEHLLAQESSQREELNQRLRLLDDPFWGVGAVTWDKIELAKGVLTLRELSVVTKQGTLIDIPGNSCKASINLASASSPASVHVHLRGDFARVEVGASMGGQPVGEPVECAQMQVVLSTDAVDNLAWQSFKLAEFVCEADKRWLLRPEFIPPLLRVSKLSPFCEPVCERLAGVLRGLRRRFMTEVEEDFLVAGGNAPARGALRSVFALQALLADLHKGMTLQPYAFFSAIRSLYLDVCVHHGRDPDEAAWAYDHDDLATCFSALLSRLEAQAGMGGGTIPYHEFARRDGLLVCDLAASLRDAKNVGRVKDLFLLVQKAHLAADVDLAAVKLAAESRIRVVYERALPGIPVTSVENPPFKHGLSATVAFFSIAPGYEWDVAVREGKVVLKDGPKLEGARFYLYWRAPLAPGVRRRILGLRRLLD